MNGRYIVYRIKSVYVRDDENLYFHIYLCIQLFPDFYNPSAGSHHTSEKSNPGDVITDGEIDNNISEGKPIPSLSPSTTISNVIGPVGKTSWFVHRSLMGGWLAHLLTIIILTNAFHLRVQSRESISCR